MREVKWFAWFRFQRYPPPILPTLLVKRVQIFLQKNSLVWQTLHTSLFLCLPLSLYSSQSMSLFHLYCCLLVCLSVSLFVSLSLYVSLPHILMENVYVYITSICIYTVHTLSKYIYNQYNMYIHSECNTHT